MSAVAFYCVADRRYYPGAVALVNSLRLNGHTEPVHLLDCGLTEKQRSSLAPHVRLAEVKSATPPWLLKTVAPLASPADVMVLIDTDMIVTRSLEPLVERAAEGRVVAFRDRQQRFFREWERLEGVVEPAPGPYVSSGFVACGGAAGREVLELLHANQPAVDFERTFWRRNDLAYPYRYADQDVLNAILSSEPHRARLVALAERLAATPPYRGLAPAGPTGTRCRFRDGTEPYLLHQYVRKPWIEPTYDGVYSRLLRRLTLAEGPVRIDEAELPLRLRGGRGARLERAKVNAKDFLRWHFGDRLPEPIGTRLESHRRRREAHAR